jgi:hypothetical protein
MPADKQLHLRQDARPRARPGDGAAGGERFTSHRRLRRTWRHGWTPGRAGDLFRTAHRISRDGDLIRDKFPPLNRCLTGYDLAHLQQDDGGFDLNSVLCGAEGSLGFVVARLMSANSCA